VHRFGDRRTLDARDRHAAASRYQPCSMTARAARTTARDTYPVSDDSRQNYYGENREQRQRYQGGA